MPGNCRPTPGSIFDNYCTTRQSPAVLLIRFCARRLYCTVPAATRAWLLSICPVALLSGQQYSHRKNHISGLQVTLSTTELVCLRVCRPRSTDRTLVDQSPSGCSDLNETVTGEQCRQIQVKACPRGAPEFWHVCSVNTERLNVIAILRVPTASRYVIRSPMLPVYGCTPPQSAIESPYDEITMLTTRP